MEEGYGLPHITTCSSPLSTCNPLSCLLKQPMTCLTARKSMPNMLVAQRSCCMDRTRKASHYITWIMKLRMERWKRVSV